MLSTIKEAWRKWLFDGSYSLRFCRRRQWKELIPNVDQVKFRRRFGIECDEMFVFVPTVPLPAEQVYKMAPNSVRTKLTLKMFLAAVRSNPCLFMWCNETGRTSLQPHLFRHPWYGKADPNFFDAAWEESQQLHLLLQLVPLWYVNASVMKEILAHSGVRISSFKDALKWSSDRRHVRIDPSLVSLVKDVEPVDVNAVIMDIVSTLPSCFIHMNDLPRTFNLAQCLHTAVQHVVEFQIPYLRVRESFLHPKKGCCDDKYSNVAPDSYTCSRESHLNVDHLSIFSTANIPNQGCVVKTKTMGFSVRCCHVTKKPLILSMCMDGDTVRLVRLSDISSTEIELLSDASIVKFGLDLRRSVFLLAKHCRLCVRSWVDIRDVLLFTGYPWRSRPATALKPERMLQDCGVPWTRNASIESTNWGSIALNSDQEAYLRLECEGIHLIGKRLSEACAVRSIDMELLLDNKAHLTEDELIAINVSVRLRSLGCTNVSRITTPVCSWLRSAIPLLKRILKRRSSEVPLLAVNASTNTVVKDSMHTIPRSSLPVESTQKLESTIDDELPGETSFISPTTEAVSREEVVTSQELFTISTDSAFEQQATASKNPADESTLEDAQAEFDPFSDSAPVRESPVPTPPLSPTPALDDIAKRYFNLAAPKREVAGSPIVDAAFTNTMSTVNPPTKPPAPLPPTPAVVSKENGGIGFMQPLLTVVPPPPSRPASALLPPTTRPRMFKPGVTMKPTSTAPEPIRPSTSGSSLGSTGKVPDEVYRKIAEEWLQTQIAQHVGSR